MPSANDANQTIEEIVTDCYNARPWLISAEMPNEHRIIPIE